MTVYCSTSRFVTTFFTLRQNQEWSMSEVMGEMSNMMTALTQKEVEENVGRMFVPSETNDLYRLTAFQLSTALPFR